MARQGRYQDVTANLRVKEVKISDTERFVLCRNPDAADRGAKVRANLVDRLEAMIADSDPRVSQFPGAVAGPWGAGTRR